jgi:hypothetical protein
VLTKPSVAVIIPVITSIPEELIVVLELTKPSVAVIIPVTLIPVELIVVPEPTIADVAVIIPTVTCEPEFSGGCASIDMVEAVPEVAVAVIANPTKLSVLTLVRYKTSFFFNSNTRK